MAMVARYGKPDLFLTTLPYANNFEGRRQVERNDIDSIISTDIPDEEDVKHHNLVKSCIIYDLCCILNHTSVCMKNGECKKRRM